MVLLVAQAAAPSSPNTPLLIAVVGLVSAVATTIINQIAVRAKTTSEASKVAKEGDSTLVESASAFIAQTGEFGQRLMERIATLENAVSERDTRINKLEETLNDLKIQLAQAEALREAMSELREEFGAERARRESAERDVARLEAIIVAAQVNVGREARDALETDTLKLADVLHERAKQEKEKRDGA